MTQLTKTRVVVTYIVLTILTATFLVPFAWVSMSAFKESSLIYKRIPVIFSQPTLENLSDVFAEGPFTGFLLNSLVVGIVVTALSIVVSAPASFALARLNVGTKNVAFWILTTRMAPPVMVMIPFYVLFRSLGFINTYHGLVLAHLSFNLPFAIWLLKDFFEKIPRSIDDAALVDGCSRFLVFLKVVLPLSLPGLAATAIFCFIFSWNELFFALVLSGIETRTFPVGVAKFAALYEVNWGGLCAAGMFGVLPVVVLAMVFQRYLVSGLTLGAVK
jgi:multiple sugar transport system permease protein